MLCLGSLGQASTSGHNWAICPWAQKAQKRWAPRKSERSYETLESAFPEHCNCLHLYCPSTCLFENDLQLTTLLQWSVPLFSMLTVPPRALQAEHLWTTFLPAKSFSSSYQILPGYEPGLLFLFLSFLSFPSFSFLSFSFYSFNSLLSSSWNWAFLIFFPQTHTISNPLMAQFFDYYPASIHVVGAWD